MRLVCATLVATILLAGCRVAPVTATASQVPTFTAEPTATAAPTFTPSPRSTPDLYWPYTIEYLRSRSYGGGQIEAYDTVGTNDGFTRYLIRYPSDGLMIHGFMNVPTAAGLHPIIIALHGYIDPASYQTLDYTTRYADALATAGYVVVHPNLRGYPPSDDGDNLFRVGMAIDVLNLVGIIKSSGGQPGPLETVDPQRIGMWGHSMGGGVTTRVITVSPDVKAAILYSAMSGDEAKNYEAIGRWSNQQRGASERAIPAAELLRISPIYFFNEIRAAVSIHHSRDDPLVPVQWSVETCDELQALGQTVECHFYADLPHTFQGQGDREFMQNTLQFFDRYLSGP